MNRLVCVGLIAMLAPLPRVSTEDECTEPCPPNVHIYADVPSTCAWAEHTVLSAASGTASLPCITCSTCSALVRIDWHCNGTCGCAYIWENHSYDKDGNPLPPEIGSGTGSGFARQLLTTDCSLQEAEYGVSVGGALYVVHLQCGCQ